jgi:hypothetical protein
LPPQAEPHLTSWNDFCRLVLKIVAELSPCSESKLLIVAAYRGLKRFGDGSLGDLSKLLGQCARELQARGLVEVNGEQFVITPAGSAENILDLTAELELHPSVRPSKPDEAATNQKQLPTQTQVTGGPKRTPEPTREEIIAAPAGSAEDILDLTAELELHPSVRPSKPDEAATNQKQLPTQTQLTGGPKRTPEPTREEIIAAMRRIISDD